MFLSLVASLVLARACLAVFPSSGAGGSPVYRPRHDEGNPLPVVQSHPMATVRAWFFLPGDEPFPGPVIEGQRICPRFRVPPLLATPSRMHDEDDIRHLFCLVIREDLQILHRRGVSRPMNLYAWRNTLRPSRLHERTTQLYPGDWGQLGDFVLILDSQTNIASLELRMRPSTVYGNIRHLHPFAEIETFNVQYGPCHM